MVGQAVNITVTDNAIKHLTNLMAAEGKAGYGLRVGVKSGGCSGLNYFMEFVEDPLPNDHVIDLNEVKVYLDVFSAMYLEGSQLDYTDGLNGSGFEWSNPNAQRTCGCGQSFSA